MRSTELGVAWFVCRWWETGERISLGVLCQLKSICFACTLARHTRNDCCTFPVLVLYCSVSYEIRFHIVAPRIAYTSTVLERSYCSDSVRSNGISAIIGRSRRATRLAGPLELQRYCCLWWPFIMFRALVDFSCILLSIESSMLRLQ